VSDRSASGRLHEGSPGAASTSGRPSPANEGRSLGTVWLQTPTMRRLSAGKLQKVANGCLKCIMQPGGVMRSMFTRQMVPFQAD
jgi:hypothetical protein